METTNNNFISCFLNKKYLIILIVLIAVCFRLINLSTNPPGIFRDEAEKGYNAYSIIQTGKYVTFEVTPTGLESRFKPISLFIEVFGVYTSAIYQFIDIPFVCLLGLNEWSTRLPACLIGIVTVLLTYILIKMTYGRECANVSALLLAISPWHIIFSRWALQGIFVPFFTVIFLILFVAGVKNKSYHLVLSAIPLALCAYSYAICRLLIPIFILLIIIIYHKELYKKKIYFAAFILLFFVLSIPVIKLFLTNPELAGERFRRISILSISKNPIELLSIFFKNYLSHYSPLFLFIKGDELSRHSLAGFGQLNFIEFPLLILGLTTLIKRRSKFDILLLGWFLMFPLASSLTIEGIPHALRSIFALPMIHIISAIGFCSLLTYDTSKKNGRVSKLTSLKKDLVLVIIILIIITIFYLVFILFFIYPCVSVFDWQYGIKDALNYINANKKPHDEIIFSGYLTGAPYLSLYYSKYKPSELIKSGLKETGFIFLPFAYPMERIYQKETVKSYYLISYPEEIILPPPDKIIYSPDCIMKSQKRKCLEVRYLKSN